METVIIFSGDTGTFLIGIISKYLYKLREDTVRNDRGGHQSTCGGVLAVIAGIEYPQRIATKTRRTRKEQIILAVSDSLLWK